MGKFGTVCGYFYSLVDFLVRTGLRCSSTVALLASLAIGVFVLGQKTNRVINEHEKVKELAYWRDPKKSGAVLAAVFVALYILANYPLLLVLTYSVLAVLAGTFGFRVFKLIEAQVKKTPAEHPFKEYLAQDLSLDSEKIHSIAENVAQCGQNTLLKLRSIVLVEDLLETAKAGLILYTLTYVGAWFSGLTLIALAVIAVFSVPKVYELYKEPIDEYLELAQNHINKITETIYEKVPMLKKSEHPQEPVKKDE